MASSICCTSAAVPRAKRLCMSGAAIWRRSGWPAGLVTLCFSRAEAVLTTILGKPDGGVGAWQALLRERIDDLPVQLLPHGWFPAESG